METVKVSPVEGIQFECFPDSTFMMEEIWRDGAYDMLELPSLAGLRVLDIGANQGFFSVYAARQGAQVFSYEPDPANFRLLSANVSGSGLEDRVAVHRAALAGKSGHVEMFKSTNPAICNSATISTSLAFLEKNKNGIFESYVQDSIRAVSLDEAVAAAGSSIDFLKIDCEGAEFEILQGASSQALRRIRWIAMETHPGYEQKDLVRILENAGFSLVEYQKPAGPLQTGLIKAARKGFTSRELRRVVSVARKGSGTPAMLSGEGSFAIGMPEARLGFSWLEVPNGKVVAATSTCLPEEGWFGPRKFTLRVEAEGLVDEDTLTWVAPLSETDSALVLGPKEKKERFTSLGATRFRIPKERFPGAWTFSKLVVQVSSADAKPLSGSLAVAGECHSMDGWYADFPVPWRPEDEDLSFTLDVGGNRSFEIAWWAEGESNRQ